MPDILLHSRSPERNPHLPGQGRIGRHTLSPGVALQHCQPSVGFAEVVAVTAQDAVCRQLEA